MNGSVAAETILGHHFAQPQLLVEALTHRSASHGRQVRGQRRGAGSNERLEFIGDRVLGLLMAEWLIERFPDEQEGDLGPRHAHLVARPILATVAEVAGLVDALDIAPGEKRAGVGSSANVLADAVEAAIGALYLDGGLYPARRFIRRAWAPAMNEQVLPPKDPKTGLQEWLMARGRPLPSYAEEARSGPSHAPEFVVRVTAGAQSATGTGASKRLAERHAAAALLQALTS